GCYISVASEWEAEWRSLAGSAGCLHWHSSRPHAAPRPGHSGRTIAPARQAYQRASGDSNGLSYCIRAEVVSSMLSILRVPRSESMRRRRRFTLGVEQLEIRNLLSGTPGLTADASLYLGDLASQGALNVAGAIATTSPADVEWYSFTLSQAATVSLATSDSGSDESFASVISLYATDGDDPNNI